MTKRIINQIGISGFVLGAAFFYFTLYTLPAQTVSSYSINNGDQDLSNNEIKPKLMGNRFLTFASVVRVNQIETSRTEFHGVYESAVHSPREAKMLRETKKGCGRELG